MDKKILNDYIDACALIRETEEDIRKLKKKQKIVLQDSVKGSMSEFPYTGKNYHIEGTSYNYADDSRLRMEEALLIRRKENAEKIKTEVEQFINTLPVRMQRIIRFRIIQKMSWDEVAAKMGSRSTADSVRMEYNNFFEKQK